MTKLNKITCPNCQKTGTWTKDNPFRPFCSERCKLIDLGSWASEEHKIAGSSVDPEQFLTSQEEDDNKH